jgi:hypothetical protein
MPSVFVMRHHQRISSEYEETYKTFAIKLNKGSGKGSEITKWKTKKQRQKHGFYFETVPSAQVLAQIYQSNSLTEQEVDGDLFMNSDDNSKL